MHNLCSGRFSNEHIDGRIKLQFILFVVLIYLEDWHHLGIRRLKSHDFCSSLPKLPLALVVDAGNSSDVYL